MADPGRGHWLKAVGHARGPLPDAWAFEGRVEVLRRGGFPRRPRIVPGDRLVLYASVHRSSSPWSRRSRARAKRATSAA